MTTVADVVSVLDSLAPRELAEDWDNVGLLLGRGSRSVRQVLTCLTLTPDVAAEAIAGQAQLIVTHHPVLFRGAKKIVEHTVEGRMLLDLLEAGVAVYSAHTRFDSAQQGVNQQLAESFGLSDITPLRECETIPGIGSGRRGTLQQPISLHQFVERVGLACAAEYVEYCGDASADVCRVAVACGAAAEFLGEAVAAGCDTFVTGEARFHSALEARGLGVNLILLGHYSSERPAMEWLAGHLQSLVPNVQVQASQVERDPLQVQCLSPKPA